MKPKNFVKKAINNTIKKLLFFSKNLPFFFNGNFLWISKSHFDSLKDYDFFNNYEKHMSSCISENLNPSQFFFDVGANRGLFSVLASKIVGVKGKVFSFEPAPEVFQILKDNTANTKNINLFQIGVGSSDGSLTFHPQGKASSASFIEDVTKINQENNPGVEIKKIVLPIKTLDSIINETEIHPDLVKIDVEGFELEVLKGAKNLLSKFHPKLIIEIHPPQLKISNGSEEEIFSILKSNGYKWETIDKNPNSLYTIFARHQEESKTSNHQ